MKKTHDEIDLVDLFIKGVNIIRNNLLLVISFFVLGILGGLAKFYTSHKIFENRMIISSAILTESYGRVLIDKVNRHLGERNIQSVSRDLKISDETAKGISRLNVEDIAETEGNKENDKFIIKVETYSQDNLQELQTGLVYYFENNEFVKVRVEQNKKYLKQVLSKIDQEISDMEDFKGRLFKGDFFQSNRGNVMFDPTVVNSKILELTKEKINLQNAMELSSSVQVIEGFTPFKNATKPRLAISLIAGSFVGLVLACMALLFKATRKILRMADAAKQKA